MRNGRTLILQTGFLGDLVLTLPLVRVLRDSRPAARITLAVREGFADLVREHPGVSETIEVRKRRGWLERIAPDLKRLRRLRASGFDEVYLAHRSFRSGLYAWSTRAPRRIGFVGSSSRWACTETVAYSTDRHVSERLLALGGPDAGNESALATPWYTASRAARNTADELLHEHGIDPQRPFVTLAPGSVWPTKRWRSEGFATLARRIAARGLPVVLIGSANERALCTRVRREARAHAVNLAGRTGLDDLAAVLERARAHVGNDSGPGHLAAAVGTPVIAIFGPTDPSAGFRPWGDEVLSIGLEGVLDCRPCSVHGSPRCPLEHHRCMGDLDPGDVLERIDAWRLSPLPPDTPRLRREGSSSRVGVRRC